MRDELGNLVPLGQLATIEMAPGPSQISRERLQRRITVELNVRGRDIGSFVEEAKGALDRDVKLPVGYYTEWAGEYERLQSAAKQLAIVIPIALALILVLLVMTFGRVRPGAAHLRQRAHGHLGRRRGARGARSAAQRLGGDRLHRALRRRGAERPRAGHVDRAPARRGRERGSTRWRGADARLRPVLTTALVASLGFLPMALATGAGAEVQRPLATVVIGGLVSSTLLTLLVIPSVYAWMMKRGEGAQVTGALREASSVVASASGNEPG